MLGRWGRGGNETCAIKWRKIMFEKLKKIANPLANAQLKKMLNKHNSELTKYFC
jgi:hypothetical protein